MAPAGAVMNSSDSVRAFVFKCVGGSVAFKHGEIYLHDNNMLYNLCRHAASSLRASSFTFQCFPSRVGSVLSNASLGVLWQPETNSAFFFHQPLKHRSATGFSRRTLKARAQSHCGLCGWTKVAFHMLGPRRAACWRSWVSALYVHWLYLYMFFFSHSRALVSDKMYVQRGRFKESDDPVGGLLLVVN